MKIVNDDPYLQSFENIIEIRYHDFKRKEKELAGQEKLADFASGHLFYGLHEESSNWVFREWAPNAKEIYLIGDFNHWKPSSDYQLHKKGLGLWEAMFEKDQIKHGQKYKILVVWNEGNGERLPSYAKYCIQDPDSKEFSAQVWSPLPFQWKNPPPPKPAYPLIYEAHIGMSTEEERVGTYSEFEAKTLPYIKEAGYNTVQLMAIQEHPYYGSFGYHVSNFFAPSSRFGTPEDLKSLIDTAHGLGLSVIMDIVHSHAVKNKEEGLGLLDGTSDIFFHANERKNHVAWDSLCFDYGKNHVLHFLLSNCKYWLEEFHFDGFRFDGITSMLYYDHGLSKNFTSYEMYYDGNQDANAITYLMLANKLIHEINPKAITIAEEMSGMPGLAEPIEDGGIGFDFRMAMGLPDYWIKTIKEKEDEKWDIQEMFFELTSKRLNEQTVSYCESHDQALVGDKTIIFRLLDKDMYYSMHKQSVNLNIDRGIALHKMIRLISFATSGGAYLNFMGNEFGHPEWIDFPREGNQWSYKYARRQWSLLHNKSLRYHYLADFDSRMLQLAENLSFIANTCQKIHENPADMVFAFSRGELLFIFNFNPQKSFAGYGIQVKGSKYQCILNVDSPAFGGHGNIADNQIHYAQREGGVSGLNWLHVYLPCRTALVMKKLETPSIYN